MKPKQGTEYFGPISRCWYAADADTGEVIRADPHDNGHPEQQDAREDDAPWPLTEAKEWGPE